MNVKKLYDYIPPRDAFLNIFIEDYEVKQVLSKFEPNEEHCICLYGISEDAVNDVLPELCKKWEEYIEEMHETISEDTLWEILCKPIFLFEDKESAIPIIDFANALEMEDFLTFIDELNRDYNSPWRYVRTIKREKVQDIIDCFEGRFCCD